MLKKLKIKYNQMYKDHLRMKIIRQHKKIVILIINHKINFNAKILVNKNNIINKFK